MTAAVRAGAYLHHIQLLSADPARLAAFYADALDMHVRTLEDAHFCEGPGRRVLFAEGPNRTLG